MKQKLPIILIIIASALTVYGALIQNRIQQACLDYGGLLASPRLAKNHSFAVEKIRNEKEHKIVYAEIYASTGGMAAIALMNFGLLGTALLCVHIRNKPKT